MPKTYTIRISFLWPKPVSATTDQVVVWFLWPKSVNTTNALVVVWFKCCWPMFGLPLENHIWTSKWSPFFAVIESNFNPLCEPELGQPSFTMCNACVHTADTGVKRCCDAWNTIWWSSHGVVCLKVAGTVKTLSSRTHGGHRADHTLTSAHSIFAKSTFSKVC